MNSEEVVKKLRQLAREGYSQTDAAVELNMHTSTVRRYTRLYRIRFQKGNTRRTWTKAQIEEKRKQCYEMVEAGKERKEIIETLGISLYLYKKFMDEYPDYKDQQYKNDPRSKVCQQITGCWHSRCYLAPRCPAYQNAQKRRRT